MWGNGRIALTIGLVAASVTAVMLAAAALEGHRGTFIDDEGNVHEAQIEAIAAEGITKGCNPPERDRYCPSDHVTRAQMASFLVRMLNLTDSSADHFADDEESVHHEDINRLAAAGVTKGCNPPANDRYCPEQPVTREQMASFLVRALNLPSTSRDHFGDDATSVHEADINRLAESGITKGCNPPDNISYCPVEPVLRDQMASFLARALGLQPIPPASSESTTTTRPGTERPQSTTTTVAPSDRLLMSTSSDRSDPVLFGGHLTGNVYPFVHPARPLRQIEFHLDDRSATGVPFQIESEAPFDMGGTVNQSEAAPFRTTRLTNGSHDITVEIIRDGEPSVTKDYSVSVSNARSLVFDPIALTFTLNQGASRTATVVTGTNDGSDTAFTVGAMGAKWLRVRPTSGSTGSSLAIDVDTSGLDVGVHEALVMNFARGYRAGELPVRLVVKSS